MRRNVFFILALIVVRSEQARGDDDWSAGFDEPAESEPEIPKWDPKVTGSVETSAFHYVRRDRPTAPFSPRYSVDGRLRAKVDNERVSVVLELLMRRDEGNSARNRNGLEQAYVDFGDGTTRVRVGRSLLRWGVTNLHRPADVLDIRDYSDFIEDEKRASYVIWVRRKLGRLFADGYLLPVPAAHIVPAAADAMATASREPSSNNTQWAARLSGSLRSWEWEVGYAFLFDRIPLQLPSGPYFRRQQIATLGVARAFGKTRIAAETAVTVPRNAAADAAGVDTDDGYVSTVLSFDQTSPEIFDAHNVQVAVDISVTQPLGGTLPRDPLSRLRYPFPLAVLGRVTYHATDWQLHLNVIQGLEGFGVAELPALGGKQDLMVQPELELSVANYVQLTIGAAFMHGASGQLVGRHRHNARIYGSAKTNF